jgi:hypothetical protein
MKGPFLKFFRCSNDFITQKVYLSRLMRAYVGLMSAAYFVIPDNHKCSIKVDWLAVDIALRLVGAVLVVYL